MHEDELPGIKVFGDPDQVGRRDRGQQAADDADRQPGHQGRLHAVELRAGRHAAGAQAEGPAGRAGRPQARLRRLQRRHPGGAARTSRRGRSTPPSPSRPTCTPSTASTTSRRRPRARRSSPARPTTAPPSSRFARACWRTSSPLRSSPATAATYGAEQSVKSTTPCGATTSSDRGRRARLAHARAAGRTGGRGDQALRLYRRARRRAASPSPLARRTRWSGATGRASPPWCHC